MSNRGLSTSTSEILGLPLFQEGVDVEFKAGQGRDKSGELPDSVWATYSAMANTEGGKIIIGVREVSKKRAESRMEILGIENVHAVQSDFWNIVNNKQKVSRNILSNDAVSIQVIEGKQLIQIVVPRAGRKERPIYVGGNPMRGTYRRNFEGDYLCDEATVRRLIADADSDSLDSRLLTKYTEEDLDLEAVAAYKNLLAATDRNHPYLVYGERQFLGAIGAWGRDRDRDEEGLTVAGLLMFGKLRSIHDVLPHYHVDYREVSDVSDERWTDRVHSDGSWSGNLFEFYRRVSRRVTDDIKVPFAVIDNQRIDDNRVKEALREAFVNALIHADYSGEMSVLILKSGKMFYFRNPGALRVSRSQAFEGNQSDCRNRNLQTMFLLIGAAEKAGSGLPKIARAWSEQKWRYPLLRDKFGPDQTTLQLTTGSLLPEESMQHLREQFGEEAVRTLQPNEAIALCAAHLEESVSNLRMQNFCDVHPRDITKMLQTLVDRAFLDAHGVASGTYYTLRAPRTTEGVKSEAVAQVVASDRASDELVKQAILDVAVDYMTPKEIAEQLNRSPETLRRRHIPELLRDGKLEQKYRSLNNPRQMYRASVDPPDVPE